MSRQSSKESTSHLFNRYVWLVNIIYRSGKITFEEICNKWTRSVLNQLGEEFPLRTFHNHRKAIEQMFDINIECDKRNGYSYFIENSEDMKRGGVRSWLLNTFAINNLINESHKLKHRILFEQIPSGQHYLVPIIEAMREGRTIEITYQSFWRDEPSTFEVEPWCVKVFKQRWYLVAKSVAYDHPRIYSLDRVSWLQQTENRFKLPKDFDAQEYFAKSFGIIHDGKAEQVEIKVWNKDKKDKYFQSLPLHHSQEVKERTDDYAIFSYYLQPTFDFRQELLSHGADVEILSPVWLRTEMSNIIKSLSEKYSVK